MDTKGCLCLVVLLAHCLLVALASSLGGPQSVFENEVGEVMPTNAQIAWLESKLRDDIAREERDLLELEQQLAGTRDIVSAKKRQLEIKKRKPYQCLVNIITCWK